MVDSEQVSIPRVISHMAGKSMDFFAFRSESPRSFCSTRWCPSSLAKLVQITPISLWFMVDITIVNGVYKPTYNWGAPHCRAPGKCSRDVCNVCLAQRSQHSALGARHPKSFECWLQMGAENGDHHGRHIKWPLIIYIYIHMYIIIYT